MTICSSIEQTSLLFSISDSNGNFVFKNFDDISLVNYKKTNLPFEYNGKKLTINLYFEDNKSELETFLGCLKKLDSKEINLYLKDMNNCYHFLSKGCYKLANLPEEPNKCPIDDTKILKFSDSVSLQKLRNRDFEIINSGEIWTGEETIYKEFEQTYVSVKMPLKLDNEQMMFGYSIKIQSYLDKIRLIKDEISQIERTKRLREQQEIESKISSISHDISAPINSAIQLIDILKITESCPNKLGYLGSVSHTMHSIKSNLRMLVKEEFLVVCDKEEVLFEEIENVVYGMYLMPAQSKGISLEISKDDKAFTKRKIYILKSKFFRILINLVNNSVKYTQEGKVEIQFSILKNNLILEIKDTGPGFSESDLQKIRRQQFQSSEEIHENSGFGWRLITSYLELLNARFIIYNNFTGSITTICIPLSY